MFDLWRSNGLMGTVLSFENDILSEIAGDLIGRLFLIEIKPIYLLLATYRHCS
jgi:hypothetical protein